MQKAALIIFVLSSFCSFSQTSEDDSPFDKIAIEASIYDLNTISSFDQSINFSGYDLELSARLELKNASYFVETGFYGNVNNALTKRFNWDVNDLQRDFYLVGTRTNLVDFDPETFSQSSIEGTNLSEQSGLFAGVGKSIFKHRIMSIEPVLRLGVRNVNFTLRQDQYLKEIGANQKEVRSLFVKTDAFAPTLSLDIRARFSLEEIFDFGVLIRYQYMTLPHDVFYSREVGGENILLQPEINSRTHYHMLNVGLTIGIGI
jgi:hypothetical protein